MRLTVEHLRLLRLLARGPRTTTELSGATARARNNMLTSLARLRAAGLVESETPARGSTRPASHSLTGRGEAARAAAARALFGDLVR